MMGAIPAALACSHAWRLGSRSITPWTMVRVR